MKIIGLCGYQNAGKTTLAEHAYSHRSDVMLLGFSDPLYEMLIAMGISPEIIYDKKRWDEPLEILCGKTTRYACKTLGTEWGRKYLGIEVWTGITINRSIDIMSHGASVIIDNVRFPDEARAIRNTGGMILAVHRPDVTPDLSHESEQHIAAIQRSAEAKIFNHTGKLSYSILLMREIVDAMIAV